MELLSIDCLGKPLRLMGNMAGWQQLFWNNQLVAQKNASADEQKTFAHEFEVRIPKEQTASNEEASPAYTSLLVRLEGDLQWQPFLLNYRLLINQDVLSQSQRTTQDIERQVPSVPAPKQQKMSLIGLASLGFKLLKSAKVIKVLLAGASVAAYSWLFSFQFAIALLACLMVHEYGHIRAMKYFGMKTKGIYIIPFLGGLALSDEKINTRWQDVVISIMGPVFGLFLSLALMVVYWITDNIFFAGLANFNALINLINLLPILPLDGGHILKSIGFSISGKVGLVILGLASVIGIVGSYQLGLSFLAFFMLIGTLELVFEWKSRHDSHLLPLDRYGQIFSAVCYTITVAALVAIMWYFHQSGDPILSAPMTILRS